MWEDRFFDFLCVVSGVGVWPRFIEPRLLFVDHVTLPLDRLSCRVRLLQISDLHVCGDTSRKFLAKITDQVAKHAPDVVVYTGDFFYQAQTENRELLESFLLSIQAPLGCYAVLGNHDYSSYVSIDEEGNYNLFPQKKQSPYFRAIKRLFCAQKVTGKMADKMVGQVQTLVPHAKLLEIFERTGVCLLHNRCLQVGPLNLCGVGEYMAGQLDNKKTFEGYRESLPGVVLVHNPDGVAKIAQGDLFLAGHTHGGYINLPGVWKKFALLENEQFKSGLYSLENRWLYVSRGVGGQAFRLCAAPQITFFELEPA